MSCPLFAAWSNRHQGRVIAYLVEENRILKEQLQQGGKRLRFTDDQRRRLAAKGKPLGEARRSPIPARPPMRREGSIQMAERLLKYYHRAAA